MHFSEYITHLQNRIAKGVPGSEFQMRMAPSHRKSLLASVSESEYRLAAVTVLIVPSVLQDVIPSVLLIERTVYEGAHSGQIALPGGKPEAGEELLAAALRELQEETGIPSHMPQILGSLTPLYIPPSRFLVHPFLAVMDHIPEIQPQEREVQRVFTIPVETLNPVNANEEEIITPEGVKIIAPFFLLDGGQRLWGATAMILSEFFALQE